MHHVSQLIYLFAVMWLSNTFPSKLILVSVTCAVIQGEGVWPTNQLLRGLPVRPPPGCHLCAGRWLEDCERRRRRISVRVGDEDGGEAVGGAQQVGFFFPLIHWEERNTHVQWDGFWNDVTSAFLTELPLFFTFTAVCAFEFGVN